MRGLDGNKQWQNDVYAHARAIHGERALFENAYTLANIYRLTAEESEQRTSLVVRGRDETSERIPEAWGVDVRIRDRAGGFRVDLQDVLEEPSLQQANRQAARGSSFQAQA